MLNGISKGDSVLVNGRKTIQEKVSEEKWAGKRRRGKNLKGVGYPTWAGKSWRGRENFPGGICFLAGKGNGSMPSVLHN